MLSSAAFVSALFSYKHGHVITLTISMFDYTDGIHPTILSSISVFARRRKRAFQCSFCVSLVFMLIVSFSCNISSTEKLVEKQGRRPSFLTNFEVVGYLMKHSFECLILLLKGISILKDIWDQSWGNFMLIKTTYPNFLHCSDFFSFWLMNYE